MPIFTVGFTAKRSPRDLRKLIYDEVRPRLAQVTGVASVTVTGGEVREIQVLAYRDRLDAVGLSVSGLAAAISSQNLDVPSGTIKEGRRTYAVRVLGQFEDLDEIRSLMISTPLGGRMPLSSLAEVRDTVVEPDRYARVDGEDSVTVAVVKQSGANTVQVVRDLRAVLTEMVGSLEENGKEGAAPKTGFLGADIKAVVANDDSEFVLQSIEDVLEDLLYGALLAAIVVFLFLHNFRGMIIVALAIPTAMLATFFPIGMGFGFTLNMMVMLGFTLSIGILVDDSVVVLENIERHLHRGEQPKAAAYNGRAEIGGAAVAITLVDVVVFIPVAMMGGMIGRFFFSFGITAGICALLSLSGFTSPDVGLMVVPPARAAPGPPGRPVAAPLCDVERGLRPAAKRVSPRPGRSRSPPLHHRGRRLCRPCRRSRVGHAPVALRVLPGIRSGLGHGLRGDRRRHEDRGDGSAGKADRDPPDGQGQVPRDRAYHRGSG